MCRNPFQLVLADRRLILFREMGCLAPDDVGSLEPKRGDQPSYCPRAVFLDTRENPDVQNSALGKFSIFFLKELGKIS